MIEIGKEWTRQELVIKPQLHPTISTIVLFVPVTGIFGLRQPVIDEIYTEVFQRANDYD